MANNEKKVLIVEDHGPIRQALAEKLVHEGMVALEAKDGEEGLATALKEKPDLILLDIIMPIMDGLEMLEHLRKTEEIKDTPVIILSARNQTEDIWRANICGIDDYIIKPFDLSELLEKIEMVLENRCSVTS